MLIFNNFPPDHPEDLALTQSALMQLEGLELVPYESSSPPVADVVSNAEQLDIVRDLGEQVGIILFANLAEPPVADQARIDRTVTMTGALAGAWSHDEMVSEIFREGVRKGATREYDATNGTALSDNL